MHLLTVRLDRIFDVVHLIDDRHQVTLFGFQCGQKRVFSVRAPGRQHLDAGAVLTACLRKRDDWTTLVGWYNHTTGETVVESAAGDMVFIVMTVVAAAVILPDASGLPLPISIVLFFMGACSIGCFYSVLSLRRVRAELARVKLAPVPALSFSADDD